MPSEKDRQPAGGRDEFEVAYYTKELGRPLQRQLLKQRLADFSGGRIPRGAEGDHVSPQGQPLQPQDEQAG
jgi:hypothetical protein